MKQKVDQTETLAPSPQQSLINAEYLTRGFSWHSFSILMTPLGSSQVTIRSDTRVIILGSSQIELIKIRNKFVLKVFAILTCQFALKSIFLLIAMFVQHIYDFFVTYGFEVFVAFTFNYFFLAVILVFWVGARRRFPLNLVLMTLITLCLTVSLAALGIYYGVVADVLFAAGMATVIFLSFTLAAIQNHCDVLCSKAACWVTLYLLFVTPIAACVLHFVVGDNWNGAIVRVCIVSLLIWMFCLWLMHVAKEVLTCRTQEVGPEEYIFGALTLYICLLFIFMITVECIKYCRKL